MTIRKLFQVIIQMLSEAYQAIKDVIRSLISWFLDTPISELIAWLIAIVTAYYIALILASLIRNIVETIKKPGKEERSKSK